MKGNTEKCHLLLNKNDETELGVCDSLIKNSTPEKPLGVKTENKLSFGEHVKNICMKANSKLRALARATPYMDIGQWKLLQYAFSNVQLNYCQLIWMIHSYITTYMKDFFDLSTMSNAPHTKNVYKIMNQFLSTIKICNKLLLKCLKSKTL